MFEVGHIQVYSKSCDKWFTLRQVEHWFTMRHDMVWYQHLH